MIQNLTIVNSGKYKLQKRTKAQVKKIIREEGKFDGFMCGNRVNPSHIADGWHLGVKIDPKTVDQFEDNVKELETGLNIYTPELGQYAHYYQVLEVKTEKERV